MPKRIVSTSEAPAAIGPYSQAVVAGGMVFLSGQIALDPATGEMVGTTAAEQAERVMDNLEAVLRAAGCSMDDLVLVTIFLASMEDFAQVNQVYGARFGAEPPARATVEVGRLPKGALVEISGVAVVP